MAEQNMPEAAFQSWLDGVLKAFRKLPDERKNRTLTSLITTGSSTQLLFLSEVINDALHMDIISHLPAEVSEKILAYLDTYTLLLCRQVCKSWKQIIGSMNLLWYSRAQQEGARLGPYSENEVKPPGHYLQLCLLAVHRLNGLEQGEGVATFSLDALKCPCSGVSRVFFDVETDSVLTVSYLNCVKVWSAQDGTLQSVVPTNHFISTLARVGDFIYTGSLRGFIAEWRITYDPNQWSPCNGYPTPNDLFIGHATPIMSLDAVEGRETCRRLIVTADREHDLRLFYNPLEDEDTSLDALRMVQLSALHTAPPINLQIVNRKSWEGQRQLVLVSLSRMECSVRAVNVSTWTPDYERVLIPASSTTIMKALDVLPSCSGTCLPCTHLPRIAISYMQELNIQQSSLTVAMFRASGEACRADTWVEIMHCSGLCSFVCGSSLTQVHGEVLAAGEKFLLVLDGLRHELLVFNLIKKTTVACISLRDGNKQKVVVPTNRKWLDGIDLECTEKLITFFSKTQLSMQ